MQRDGICSVYKLTLCERVLISSCVYVHVCMCVHVYGGGESFVGIVVVIK